VRVALQALAAVMGGTQSLHTNGFDEALGLPTEEAARIALRTQQIIGYESGVVDTPDPLAGSYFVESLTDEVEASRLGVHRAIDAMGGAVEAIEAGYQMDEIEQAAYEYTKSIDDDERVIVGVNKFTIDDEPEPRCSPSTPSSSGARREQLAELRASRDDAEVAARLDEVRAAARGTENLLYPMKEALRARATLGEVSDALREVFGVYQPGR
jgi:methylmalonyl-CoA mutase, N-terminal domain